MCCRRSVNWRACLSIWRHDVDQGDRSADCWHPGRAQESVGAIREISGTIEKLSEISSTIAAVFATRISQAAKQHSASKAGSAQVDGRRQQPPQARVRLVPQFDSRRPTMQRLAFFARPFWRLVPVLPRCLKLTLMEWRERYRSNASTFCSLT